MNSAERTLRHVDAYQQRHTPLAVTFAVIKKFGDDRAGNLVSVIAYSGFVAMFPLLLIFFTILGLVLAHDPSAHRAVTNSALHNFPLVGEQLSTNVHTLKRTSVVGLVVGLVVVAWGSLGLAQAGMYAMSQVWNVPGPERPRYAARLLRSVEFLGVLAGGVLVTTVLASFGTIGGHWLPLRLLGEALAVIVNIGQYLLAFRILTPHRVGTRALVPGAVLGGVGWTVLLAAGGYLVGHQLKHAGAVYGTFGLVLGLLAWIYLGARLSLYAAELNTVLDYRLWPRTMVQPPFTDADQRMLELRQRTAIVRAEQEVHATFTDHPMTQREYLDQNGRSEAETSTLTVPSEEVPSEDRKGGES